MKEVIEQVKTELAASLEKADKAFSEAVKVTTDLEMRKVSLLAEVLELEKSIVPKRKEAEGQHKHVREAIQAATEARVEADAKMATIKAEIKAWEDKRAEAIKRADAAFLQRQTELEEKIVSLEKQLAEKQKKLDAFQEEWTK